MGADLYGLNTITYVIGPGLSIRIIGYASQMRCHLHIMLERCTGAPMGICSEAKAIGQHGAPWSSQHLQKAGKALLEKGEIVASFLDGVELTPTIPLGETNKSIYYLIGNHEQFHFTVTPCTGPLSGIHFYTIKTAKDGWNSDRSVFSKWTHRARRSSDILSALKQKFWFQPELRVEPLIFYGNLDLQKVLKGPNWLKGSDMARLHFACWGASGDTLVVTLYGQPGSSFKARWSLKRDSNYQPLYGYPQLPQPSPLPLVDVCLSRIDGGRQLFINVYAMNDSVNLSSAYPPRVFPSVPLCNERRPVTRVWVKLRPVTYTVHWSRNIIFDWPQDSRNISLYLQPCRRPQNQEYLYTLQIFQQKALDKQENDVPIATVRIPNKPFVDLSRLSRLFDKFGGTLWIRLFIPNSTSGNFPTKGDKVARLFFLNQTANNPLPVRPLLKGESKILKSIAGLQDVDNDNYPVEFRPICQLHQIAMKMVISSEPQTYLITTVSVSNAKNINHSEIRKQIHFCENSINSLARYLGPETRVYSQRVVTGLNETTLDVQLPFSYGYGSPRYYFVLVYASHADDVTAAYRSLFFYRMIDACHLIEYNCYSNGHCS
ncbi:hypothetical protein Aperf_G00000111109 [Anoplocephala perfoliata]